MKYYKIIPTQSRAGVKYTKLVKADASPSLQKSANGVYFKTILAPAGNTYAVIVHKKGELKPQVGMRFPEKRKGRRKLQVA